MRKWWHSRKNLLISKRKINYLGTKSLMQTLIIYNYYINSTIPPKKCDAVAFPTIIPTRLQNKSDKNTSNGKAVCSNDSPKNRGTTTQTNRPLLTTTTPLHGHNQQYHHHHYHYHYRWILNRLFHQKQWKVKPNKRQKSKRNSKKK